MSGKRSAGYTLFFAIAVCGVCSILVSVAAVTLKEQQQANFLGNLQRNVLIAAELLESDEPVDTREVTERFAKRVKVQRVALPTGETLGELTEKQLEQRLTGEMKVEERPVADNEAKVLAVPEESIVYQVVEQGRVTLFILPVEGQGLWGRLYGFLALKADARTIAGLVFYEHKETPGLGGEVDNPKWRAKWKDRRAFDGRFEPVIEVIKGNAGPPERDPHRVDGLSGATMTSRGVTALLRFWLSDQGYGNYLKQHRVKRDA